MGEKALLCIEVLFLVKGQVSIAADYLIWSHINSPPENIWDT